MKRRLGLVLRLAVAGACLVYAFWGVDPAALGRALAGFVPAAVAVTLVLQAADYLSMGLRMNYLAGGRLGLGGGLDAALVGLGVNNILPAKLGEVAKAMSMRRSGSIPMGESLGLVFWERFTDLHMLLVLGLVVSVARSAPLLMVPLGLGVAGIWAGVFFFRGRTVSLARLEKSEAGRRVNALLGEVFARMSRPWPVGFYVSMALFSLVIWGLYCLQYVVLLRFGAGLDLVGWELVVVFALAATGMAAPSLPGAVGVYEAVVVAALGLYGVDKEKALACGLVIHFLQYIPPTAYALAVFARGGLSLEGVRRGAASGRTETQN